MRAEAEQVTGEAILDAALAAFAQEPFDRVTLQRIAAASGVTVQTVIRRFGSKEQLFEALGERERVRVLCDARGCRRRWVARGPGGALKSL